LSSHNNPVKQLLTEQLPKMAANERASLSPTMVNPTKQHNVVVKKMPVPLEKSTSFKNDPRVVEKTNELMFFCSEPGAGIIFLGFLLEPHRSKDMIIWLLSLGSGCALSSQKPLLAKIGAFLLGAYALRPPGDGKYIRFFFGMATVMRFLRLCEVLLSPKYFEERGLMFTTKFCFLYVSKCRKLSKLNNLVTNDIKSTI
jgi:hypothetical protein